MLTCGFSFGTVSPNGKSILVANSRSGKGETNPLGFQRVMAQEASLGGQPRAKSLSHRLIEHPGDVGDEGGAFLLVVNSPNENHKHERALGIYDRRIVMDLLDFAGLMSNARSLRKARRDAFVERLFFKDRDHGAAGVFVDRLALRDGGKKHLEPAGRGGVVESLFVGLLIFNATQDLHAVRAKRMDGGANVFDA